MTPTVPEPPYDIVLTPGVGRALSETLSEAVAVAAWEFIIGPLARQPRVVGTLLRAPFDRLWRARRVVVLSVDHRLRRLPALTDCVCP